MRRCIPFPLSSNSELHSSNSAHLCSGGEGGIRTHGPIAGTHAFQACRFDHSRTSPHRFSQGGILTRGLMTGKVTAVLIAMTLPVPETWATSLSMGEDSKALTGKVQAQVKEKKKEAIGSLLKNCTKSGDLK